MNFFGHSHFAKRIRNSAGYVLGSMLPDFEGMSGTKLVDVHDPSIRDGIALHHATDSVFHGAPEFLELCARGLSAMTEGGVHRATARACAHVGVELVFDSYLLEHGGPNETYVDALERAHRADLGGSLAFSDGGDRFEMLRSRLATYGIPHGYADPRFVTDRLEGALRFRPRLAMRGDDRRVVERWVESETTRIHALAPAIVARVDAALGLVETAP